MSRTLRVVIAEDNHLVREGVRRLLEDSGQIEVVACVGDATFCHSVAYITRICQAKSKGPLPLIVAAAGNGNPNRSGYPAVLPSAVVAVALETDAAGQLARANYNSTTPANAIEQKAFGGAQDDPVATVTSPGGPVTNLYGTSFATAAVAAAYLP
jgi:hypothetical protein